MFVSYIEQIKRAHDRRMAKYTSTSTPTLKDICLKTVSHHVDVLEKKALDLPVSLIKELLPHLNIVDLDRIQPAVNLRGISTSFVWAGILREISGPRKGITRLTEVEWREKIMNKLFNMAFYSLRFRGDAKYLLNVNFNTLLLVMAKYIQHLLVFRTSPPCGFIERRPVLSVLETTVRSIQLEVNSRLREFPGDVLYALHRLLDHGAARSVVIAHSPDPCLLAWILHGRGPQSASNQCPLQSIHGEREPGGAAAETTAACLLLEDAEPEGTQPKRPRLSIASAEEKLDRASCPCQCMDPKPPCQMFVPSASPSKESCPKGQIHSLAINCFRDGILPVLLPLLPSWLCLRSLSLHSAWTFEEGDVLSLAECLRRLSEQGGCSLTELSVGSLPHPALMESLLNACPSLRSFSMEIHPVAEYQHAPLRSVRQHTHQTESNRQLKELTLEDMNLSDCHCAIFQLLDHNCMLEVLSLKDCRLLEKCSKKEDAVRQLVNSIKKVSTLRSLNLVQNRLAKNVIVLGELFMGPSPSTLKELDISSNFIKPSELLEFGRLLETHHPPWRLLVTLKSNPLDREMALKDTALGTLSHVCDLITDHWNSKDTMADHVSIM
uniref:Leucine-rich repeat-containing protein 41 n=1 Tax=Esox lucius TaxID=8010 RepID=A0AAY5KAK1_ESOLU